MVHSTHENRQNRASRIGFVVSIFCSRSSNGKQASPGRRTLKLTKIMLGKGGESQGQGRSLCHSLPRGLLRSGAAAMVLLSMAAVTIPAGHTQSANAWSKRGADAEVSEDWDAAFEAYRQAHLLKPKDLRYKTHFERARFSAAAAHVDRGRVLRQSGDMRGALTEFERALAIDGGNQAAQQEITVTERLLSDAPTSSLDLPVPVGPTPDMLSISEPLKLKPVSNNPLTLHMVEDTKVLYQAIGKEAGLNVIFDPDYTSRRIALDLNNVSLNDALRILGTQAGTFYKAVTNNTIFVAQNTQTKRTDLASVAVQTFYLSNAATQADQNELLTALRNVLDQNVKIFLVPSQNAIVMRATPDQLLLTQELLNNLDRPHSEVVVDVAVLEVNRDRARNLGVTLPQSFSITPQVANSTTTSSTTGSTTTTGSSTSSTSTSPTLNTLAHLTGANFAVSLGTATVNALLTDNDTRVLQNPRIRATDGQRAQLKIGQRIPIATGSYSSGASTSVVSSLVNTQFQYIDVGVLIDMTPTVHADREITLKMALEISSQNGSVSISGVTQPIIAQRKVEQVIQLKEGEPSILAGILSRSETDSISGTPGLASIPILKNFFRSNNRDRAQDEVVFLLIPHIVREPLVTRMNTRALDTGTGQSIELRHDAVPESVATDTSASLSTGAFQQQRSNAAAANGAPLTAAQAAAAMIGQVGNENSPGSQRAMQALAAGGTPTTAATAAAQAIPGAGGPVSFSITPGQTTQAMGSTFQMAVIANGAKDLYSVPLQVQFNPSLLSLVNVDSGEFLGRDGQSVAIVHRDEGNGMVTISISRPPAVRGMDGQGSVCVLTFRANAPGDSQVSLVKVGAKDSAQTNLPAVGSAATVHVR
ncbi:type II secretory pathway, component PulD [Terriglobus roseus DSM 18391]|uniref:Type II secretory pathway, component PulD n=1 Tax=Terriglobus roseus (strain DSM 18391 / NRRL B-41598 / KBS 63) TaxID=926566 RepID=I3ZET2_TERRK|nr:type II secretory pathway, component PulD [Terriglobus roseus DSM 18391]